MGDKRNGKLNELESLGGRGGTQTDVTGVTDVLCSGHLHMI